MKKKTVKRSFQDWKKFALNDQQAKQVKGGSDDADIVIEDIIDP